MKKALIPLFAAMALVAVPGCEIGPVVVPSDGTVYGMPASTTPSSATPGQYNGAIIVNGLAANPSNIATRNDKITFSVNAFDNNSQPMQYSWSSTKGTLSATEGQTVYWSPINSTGALEQGVATVQVLITDSTGASKQAAVNLLIHPDGSAETTAPPALTTTTSTTTNSTNTTTTTAGT